MASAPRTSVRPTGDKGGGPGGKPTTKPPTPKPVTKPPVSPRVVKPIVKALPKVERRIEKTIGRTGAHIQPMPPTPRRPVTPPTGTPPARPPMPNMPDLSGLSAQIRAQVQQFVQGLRANPVTPESLGQFHDGLKQIIQGAFPHIQPPAGGAPGGQPGQPNAQHVFLHQVPPQLTQEHLSGLLQNAQQKLQQSGVQMPQVTDPTKGFKP